MADILVNFKGNYWNQQTFVFVQTSTPPDWSVECHDSETPFAFRPGSDFFIQADNGSMRLEKTAQDIRSLATRPNICSGKKSKNGTSIVSITFSSRIEVDHFRITLMGAINDPGEAYLVVPRKVLTIPAGTSVMDVTSGMMGTRGRVGPIRFVQIQHNRAENRILKFSYNVSQRLNRGEFGFPPSWG